MSQVIKVITPIRVDSVDDRHHLTVQDFLGSDRCSNKLSISTVETRQVWVIWEQSKVLSTVILRLGIHA